jgi:hypothetical protein
MNAIEQAIEALESAIRVYEASSPSVMTVERRQCVDAITALQSMQGEAVAYAVFADNGNIRIWCADPIQIETLKQKYGQYLTPLYTHPQSPAVVDGLDFDLIAAVLEDYCFLQTSGIVSAANRYSTSDVNEQIDLLTASGKGVNHE